MAKIVWLLAALLCISFDASAAAGGCPREVVSRQSYAGVLEAIRCGAGFCTAEIESDGPHEVFLKPAAKSSLGMIGSGVRVKTVTVRYVSQGVCGAREVLADVSVISDPPYSDDELAPGFDICESAAEGDDGMTACGCRLLGQGGGEDREVIRAGGSRRSLPLVSRVPPPRLAVPRRRIRRRRSRRAENRACRRDQALRASPQEARAKALKKPEKVVEYCRFLTFPPLSVKGGFSGESYVTVKRCKGKDRCRERTRCQ